MEHSINIEVWNSLKNYYLRMNNLEILRQLLSLTNNRKNIIL